MICDAVEFIAGHHSLPGDDLLLDYVTIRRCRPVEGSRVRSGVTHFVDSILRDAKIPESEHRPFQFLVGVGAGHLSPRPHGDDEVRLGGLYLRAVDPEQRLALAHMLSGLVDEQFLDEAVRPERDDCQKRLVVLDPPNRPDGTMDLPSFHFLGSHTAPLDLVETDFDGAWIILFVRIDGDVVHPHGILLRDRRGVRRTHRIAVIENFAFRRGRRMLRARGSADWSLKARIPIDAGDA